MRYFRGLRQAVSQFGGDRGGNFAILFGGVATTLAVAVGFGVDTAQMMNARSVLRAAVDSAVTSTARDLTTGNATEDQAKEIVKAFIAANNPNGVLSSGQIVLDDLDVNRATKTVTATAHVDVAMFFPVFGMDNVRRISDTGAAVYSDKQIEVAMMLDLTGSMAKTNKTNKIGDLQTAAKNAVSTMLDGQDPKNPRVRVAIVPYASGVDVGALGRYTYAETSSSSDLPPVEGSAPLVAKTGKTVLPGFDDYLSIVGAAYPNADSCATERKTRDGKADYSADGPSTVRTDKSGKRYYALVNRDDKLGNSDMTKCPQAKIIPLTADEASLLNSIKTFKANGFTGGAIAVQWTYYMLSQQWRSAIQAAGLGDGPTDANARKISKVAILMTDGQFNTAYAGISGTNNNNQGDVTRSNAEAICSNMKADGIQVFTIGFDLDDKDMSATERQQAKSVLKNCSSTDTSMTKHYYEASTGEELDQAFQDIIANTEKVALTQ